MSKFVDELKDRMMPLFPIVRFFGLVSVFFNRYNRQVMDFQKRLLSFLDGDGHGTLGIPVPILDKALAKTLLSRIENMQWYLNRYSLELNFSRGRLSVDEFIDLARSWGFEGVQLHNAKQGPRVCLSGESDEFLRRMAKQEGKRNLDIQLDISSTSKSDIEDAARVARAIGARVIRCYIRTGGTLKEILRTAVDELSYAAEVAEKWSLEILLEQHEILTGHEMVDVIERVNHPRIGILFDFGNPVAANREPLDDLMVMREHIRGTHCKDVRVLEASGIRAKLGVEMGSGHLNLEKIFFDLLCLGSDHAQVKFFSIQMVVDYLSLGNRSPAESKNKIFEKRNPSATAFPKNITQQALKKRLKKEKIDAQAGFNFSKNLVEDLRKLLSE
ncbi:MAG: sugar phosphate isomerase/epimerase [Caldithrix sp.]|nr:MAG: sugar phosphate isomerase/epimerase [Caldithrix sp.]